MESKGWREGGEWMKEETEEAIKCLLSKLLQRAFYFTLLPLCSSSLVPDASSSSSLPPPSHVTCLPYSPLPQLLLLLPLRSSASPASRPVNMLGLMEPQQTQLSLRERRAALQQKELRITNTIHCQARPGRGGAGGRMWEERGGIT